MDLSKALRTIIKDSKNNEKASALIQEIHNISSNN
jgi:hypothetical protein